MFRFKISTCRCSVIVGNMGNMKQSTKTTKTIVGGIQIITKGRDEFVHLHFTSVNKIKGTDTGHCTKVPQTTLEYNSFFCRNRR